MTYRTLGALVAVLLVGTTPVWAQGGGEESFFGATAAARPAAEWDADGKPTKLDFDFGDFKAWVRKKGGWQVTGWIHHRGLACATYEVGLRVGQGEPGCNDVVWFSEPQYLTSRRQCNNASTLHEGGDVQFPFAARFAQITCAERVVRCTGNCKLSFHGEESIRRP